MRKVLIGLLTAVILAAAGFFGFELYLQHRIGSEIEAAFEQIRAAGGKASHGRVSFDLLSQTVTVADIAGESGSQPPVSVKIASVTAAGLSEPDVARFSANRIDLTDVEIGVEAPADTLLRVTYSAPSVVVRDYSGPADVRRLPASTSFVDLYRFGFEQLAIMKAASVVAPSLTGKMKFSPAMRGGGGDGDFTYSGLGVEGIENGKIAAMKADDFLFTFVQPAGKARKISGNLANFVAYDADINAMAAIYDAQKASDDRYYRVYRQISAGAFTVRFDQVLTMRVEGVTFDDLAMRPSRLQVAALTAMTPPAGVTPTPAQEREILETVAGVYEGVRIGNAEMRGLLVEAPQGPLKLATTRFNMENGKIGELAFEGLDARAPNGPVKVGRFALKSLDISNLMRMAAQFSNPAQPPSPNAVLGIMPLIEGAELTGLVAPYKDSKRSVNIDTLNLDWGQFIGPIPSRAHLTAKMSTPVDRTDPKQAPLVAAGMDTVAIDVDLGAAWTEASSSFALSPATVDLGGLLNASAGLSLANVPRGVFSLDPQQATTMAAQIEAGTLQLKLRDTGGVDLAVAQYARSKSVSRDASRRAMIDNIRAGSETAAAANPDAAAAVEALARFVETPGQTLNLKLTPLGKVPALQLIQLLKTDPLVALAQFRIEASTGL